MKTNRAFAWIVAGVLLTGTMGATAAFGQKASKNPSRTKVWLTAMDTDHDGTVSKEEFTAYMQLQLDNADADRDGTLDRKELEQLRTK